MTGAVFFFQPKLSMKQHANEPVTERGEVFSIARPNLPIIKDKKACELNKQSDFNFLQPKTSTRSAKQTSGR